LQVLVLQYALHIISVFEEPEKKIGVTITKKIRRDHNKKN